MYKRQVLPNPNTHALTETEARRLGGENRGLIYVQETPRGSEAAKDFQAGTSGAFSDVASQKPAVPALRYDNANPKGVDYIKFDGIEVGSDGSNILLVDAKRQLPLWNNSAKDDLLATFVKIESALRQNPGYRVMYEFPNERARKAAQEFLERTGYDRIVYTRVRRGGGG